MKDAILHTRVNSEDKKKAEKILKNFGFSLSSAIDLYLKAIIRVGGIPFEINEKEELNMLKEIRASMAMEGFELSEETVAMLKAYKCDGSESDKKIISDLKEKYRR